MKLISTDTKEATLVTLEGALDGKLATELERFFTTCNAPVKQTIHIDLKKIEAIKPDGARVLLNAHVNAISGSKYILKLLNANKDVKQLLNTIGLGQLVS